VGLTSTLSLDENLQAQVAIDTLIDNNETELWYARIDSYLAINSNLHKTTRAKISCVTIMLTFLSIIFFVIFSKVTISPSVFWLSAVLLAVSVTCYPAIFFLERRLRKQRDLFSKKFYENNYELDFATDKILLINRATYEVVVTMNRPE
jgi:magnesium-transporting ATPase (P-type)